jgi:predicted transcriptional regulator YdeE
LTAEPECKLVFAEDGKSYTWDGKIIGNSELVITAEEAPNSIRYRLSIFKPWKSVNTSRFEFANEGAGTKVSWSMEGTMPFHLFFFKGMMTTFVGMDYERGLRMLKDYLETGSVPSQMEFEGVKRGSGFSYVGIRSSCHLSEIGPEMEKSFRKLHEAMAGGGFQPAGAPFSLYHKWQMTKQRAQFTTGFPVATVPVPLPEGFVSGEVPASELYAVKHTGSYRHIGNAWSASMMHAQAKVFPKSKKFEPYEVYENSPQDVPGNELATVVNLGVK